MILLVWLLEGHVSDKIFWAVGWNRIASATRRMCIEIYIGVKVENQVQIANPSQLETAPLPMQPG